MFLARCLECETGGAKRPAGRPQTPPIGGLTSKGREEGGREYVRTKVFD